MMAANRVWMGVEREEAGGGEKARLPAWEGSDHSRTEASQHLG